MFLGDSEAMKVQVGSDCKRMKQRESFCKQKAFQSALGVKPFAVKPKPRPGLLGNPSQTIAMGQAPHALWPVCTDAAWR